MRNALLGRNRIRVVVLVCGAASLLFAGTRPPLDGGIQVAAPAQGRKAVRATDPQHDAQPMTRAQGAAILKELREIHRLLEARQSGANSGVRPAAPVRRPKRPVVAGKLRMQADWHGLGRRDAPVTIVEFTDLQCPYCERFQTQTFPRLKAEYIDTGKVRFIARDFPLMRHAYAAAAAEADRCAGDQGKFWQFREAILQDPAPAAPAEIRKQAARLGLDAASFQRCIQTKKYAAAIRQDELDATALHVEATPSFLIGRVTRGWLHATQLRGALPLSAFQSAIESALRAPGTRPLRAGASRTGGHR